MSRKKNNKDRDPKSANDPGNMHDAFEREAAEGFAMLENSEEVRSAKQELDERIYKEVFAKRHTKRLFFYWTAAAGLLLLIGFAVYFVLDTSKEKTLALQQQPINTDVAAGAQSQTAPAQMAAPVAAEVETNKKLSEKAGPGPEEHMETLAKKEEAASKKVAFKNINQSARQNEGEGSVSALGDVNAASAPPAAQSPVFYSSGAEDHEDDVAATKSKEDIVANHDLSKDTDTKAIEQKVVTISKNSKSRSQEQIQLSPPVSAPSTFNTGAPLIQMCNYKGGDLKLKEDVSKLLDDESLRKSFDVKFTLNQKGGVSEALILQSTELTAEQKLLITKKLKKLNEFECKTVKGQNYPIVFMYSYRP